MDYRIINIRYGASRYIWYFVELVSKFLLINSFLMLCLSVYSELCLALSDSDKAVFADNANAENANNSIL